MTWVDKYALRWGPWYPLSIGDDEFFLVQRAALPPNAGKHDTMGTRFKTRDEAERYCAMLALGGAP